MKHFRSVLLLIFVFNYFFLSAQWTQIVSPISQTNLTSLYFINDSVGYAGDENSLIKTTDGGLSWELNEDSGFVPLKQAYFSSAFEGVGISNDHLYRTENGGIDWIDISDSVDIINFYELVERNGTIFLTGSSLSNNFWYASIDDGKNWELRNVNDSVSNRISYVINANELVFIDPSGWWGKSNDGGVSWQNVFSEPLTDVHYTNIYFRTPDTGFVIEESFSSSGTIMKTTNGFLNQGYFYPEFHGSFTGPFWCIDGQEKIVYAAGGAQEAQLLVSKDGGHNWYLQDLTHLSPGGALRGIHVFDENKAIIVGDEGTILFTNTAGDPLSTTSFDFSNIRIYPNPTQDFLYIERQDKLSTEMHIELVGMQGKRISQHVMRCGENGQSISLANLSAGVYIVKIHSENKTINRKIIVE